MSPPKHAYVRYCDNNSCAIVDVNDVKDFHPKDEADFASRPYLVKWTDRSGESDFYSARILLLGDSPEEITKKREAKRVRVPRQLSSDSSDVEKREVDGRAAVPKKKKPNHELLAILEKKKKAMKAKTPDELEAFRTKLKEKDFKIAKLEQTITDQEVTIDKLRELNEGLQETVIFMRGNFRVPAPAAATCREAEMPSAERERPHLPSMASLPACPSQLGTTTQHPHPQQPGKAVLTEHPSKSYTQPRSPLHRPVTPPALDLVPSDKVDIGKGLLVSADTWATVKDQHKDSIFVKSLVVAVWDPAKLRNKSLQGKHCPRFPGRPKKDPLTPWKLNVLRECFKDRLREKGLSEPFRPAELKAFNRYVSEKLADIEKVAKRTEQQTSNSTDATEGDGGITDIA